MSGIVIDPPTILTPPSVSISCQIGLTCPSFQIFYLHQVSRTGAIAMKYGTQFPCPYSRYRCLPSFCHTEGTLDHLRGDIDSQLTTLPHTAHCLLLASPCACSLHSHDLANPATRTFPRSWRQRPRHGEHGPDQPEHVFRFHYAERLLPL